MRSLKGAFMTQLLIRLFIRRPNSPQDPRIRAAYGNLASVVGMVCNVLLCLGKFVVGTLFGSIAITADALNNLSDASSNIVSLVGFKLAAKAPDAEHPYGHARFEYLAGLVVSVTILGIGFSLLKESVTKVLHPTPVQFGWLTVAVLVVSILVKLWMSSFNRAIGRIISSETLIATAAVLVAAILCRVTGWDVLDGLMGVGVAVFILISGWGLVMDTLSPLLGESPSEDLVDHIEQKVLSYPGVLGMHDLMVHDYGPGHQFASLHVELPAEQDPLEAHDLIDNIERDFMKNDHLMVTIHYDPIVTSDAAVGVLRSRLTEKLRQLDPALSLHDLRIVPGNTHVNVVFDCIVPYDLNMEEGEIKRRIAKSVQAEYPNYFCVATLERSYVSGKK